MIAQIDLYFNDEHNLYYYNITDVNEFYLLPWRSYRQRHPITVKSHDSYDVSLLILPFWQIAEHALATIMSLWQNFSAMYFHLI